MYKKGDAPIGLPFQTFTTFFLLVLIIIFYSTIFFGLGLAKSEPTIFSSEEIENNYLLVNILKTPIEVEGQQMQFVDLIYLWEKNNSKYNEILYKTQREIVESVPFIKSHLNKQNNEFGPFSGEDAGILIYLKNKLIFGDEDCEIISSKPLDTIRLPLENSYLKIDLRYSEEFIQQLHVQTCWSKYE